MSDLIAKDQCIIEIGAVRRVRTAIEKSLSWEYPSLITGCPGNGKSTALAHLCEEFGGYYIEIKPSIATPVKFLEKLSEVIRGYSFSRTQHGYESEITTALMWQKDALICVDEHSELEARAMFSVVRICEDSGAHLVFSGNSECPTRLPLRDVGIMEKIRDRIGSRTHIAPPGEDDCRLIAAPFNVEGEDAHAALAHYASKTSLRSLMRLLAEARDVAGKFGNVELRHIRNATLSIHGDKQKLQLLRPE